MEDKKQETTVAWLKSKGWSYEGDGVVLTRDDVIVIVQPDGKAYVVGSGC